MLVLEQTPKPVAITGEKLHCKLPSVHIVSTIMSMNIFGVEVQDFIITVFRCRVQDHGSNVKPHLFRADVALKGEKVRYYDQ